MRGANETSGTSGFQPLYGRRDKLESNKPPHVRKRELLKAKEKKELEAMDLEGYRLEANHRASTLPHNYPGFSTVQLYPLDRKKLDKCLKRIHKDNRPTPFVEPIIPTQEDHLTGGLGISIEEYNSLVQAGAKEHELPGLYRLVDKEDKLLVPISGLLKWAKSDNLRSRLKGMERDGRVHVRAEIERRYNGAPSDSSDAPIYKNEDNAELIHGGSRFDASFADLPGTAGDSLILVDLTVESLALRRERTSQIRRVKETDSSDADKPAWSLKWR